MVLNHGRYFLCLKVDRWTDFSMSFIRNIIIRLNNKNAESYIHVSTIVYKYSLIQTFDLKLVCGMNCSYFSRRIREETGLTPLAYRRTHYRNKADKE